jgi:hypothetical protein
VIASSQGHLGRCGFDGIVGNCRIRFACADPEIRFRFDWLR